MAGLLDIVNDRDEVIGWGTSERVHARRLLHRFVQGFVIRCDGRIVIQQRSRNKQRGPLLYDASIGGHVEHGETYDTAIVREGSEELGLIDASYKSIGEMRDNRTKVENMIGRLYLTYHDGPFTGWETEAERLITLSPEELHNWVSAKPEEWTGPMPDSTTLLLAALKR